MPDPTLLTLPQLASIVDIEYRRLHTWVVRGLLLPSVQTSTGTGNPHLFTVGDAVRAKVLADLRRAGVRIALLEQAADVLREREEELLAGVFVLVNGSVQLVPDAKAAADFLESQHWTVVYNGQRAVDSVREQLARVPETS